MKTIGGVLKEIRESKRIPRKAVAIDFGVTNEAVRDYEQMKGANSTVQKLCAHYKVPVSAVWILMVDESDLPEQYLKSFRDIKRFLIR